MRCARYCEAGCLEDRTRAVAGVADPLALEERIASLVAEAIEPLLLPEIEIIPWRRTHVVAVTVHPSAQRPHHLRAEGRARGTYVRLGSTNRVCPTPSSPNWGCAFGSRCAPGASRTPRSTR